MEAHGGFKSEQQFNIDFYAGTNTYLPPIVPGTYSKNNSTGEVKFYDNVGLGDKETTTQMFGERANIFAEISTKNPATPKWLPTPAITDTTIKLSWAGYPKSNVLFERTIGSPDISSIYAFSFYVSKDPLNVDGLSVDMLPSNKILE